MSVPGKMFARIGYFMDGKLLYHTFVNIDYVSEFNERELTMSNGRAYRIDRDSFRPLMDVLGNGV